MQCNGGKYDFALSGRLLLEQKRNNQKRKLRFLPLQNLENLLISEFKQLHGIIRKLLDGVILRVKIRPFLGNHWQFYSGNAVVLVHLPQQNSWQFYSPHKFTDFLCSST